MATEAATRVLEVLRELVGRYEDLIVKDPDVASKIESALRLVSYLVPGTQGVTFVVRPAFTCVLFDLQEELEDFGNSLNLVSNRHERGLPAVELYTCNCIATRTPVFHELQIIVNNLCPIYVVLVLNKLSAKYLPLCQ